MDILIEVIAAVFFVAAGLAILRKPEGRLFWTDRIGLWVMKWLRGPLPTFEAERRLRRVSRLKAVGWIYLILGLAVLAACVVDLVYRSR